MSSSLLLLFTTQVIWYFKPQPKNTTMMHSTYGSNGALNEEPLEADDCDESPLIADPEESVEVDRTSVEEMASVCTHVMQTTNFRARIRDIPGYQLFFAMYLCLAVAVFSVCVCLNTPSHWGIFAPPLIFLVLLCALLYRNHREGRMHFADSLLTIFHKLRYRLRRWLPRVTTLLPGEQVRDRRENPN